MSKIERIKVWGCDFDLHKTQQIIESVNLFTMFISAFGGGSSIHTKAKNLSNFFAPFPRTDATTAAAAIQAIITAKFPVRRSLAVVRANQLCN